MQMEAGMRFLINLFSLLASLPWWGALLVVAGLVAAVYCTMLYLKWKFHKIIRESVLEAGSALKDAGVMVHSVTAAAAPEGPSPYDLTEDDEQFSPELDGTPWEADDADFYLIDATITPADPAAEWDPTALSVVPADFVGEDATDMCLEMGGLHSAQIYVNGQFQPAKEETLVGPQRVKLLFGIPNGVRAVKFASLVTYFGRVELPKPLPKKLAATRR